MTTDIYKDFIPEAIQEKMKASETTKIRKEEESLMFWVMGTMAFGFMFTVSVISFLLWMNKFTLFFSLVFALIFIPIFWLQIKVKRTYKKRLKAIIEKYENE